MDPHVGDFGVQKGVAGQRLAERPAMSKEPDRGSEASLRNAEADCGDSDPAELDHGHHLMESPVQLADESIARHDTVIELEPSDTGALETEGAVCAAESETRIIASHKEHRDISPVLAARPGSDDDEVCVLDVVDQPLGAAQPPSAFDSLGARNQTGGIRSAVRLCPRHSSQRLTTNQRTEQRALRISAESLKEQAAQMGPRARDGRGWPDACQLLLLHGKRLR